MSDLVNTVTSLVRAMAPDYDYRWSDAMIKQMVHLADLEIREQADMEWAEYEIELDPDTYWYNLPTDVIEVRSVMYSRDGLDFEDMLRPVTIDDIDRFHWKWRDDTGTPEYYSLLSTPGIVSFSKILIWPALGSVSSEKINIHYLKCREDVSDIASIDVPDRVIQNVYLPYVLGVLRANEDPAEAEMYMSEYRRGLLKVRGQYQHRFREV